MERSRASTATTSAGSPGRRRATSRFAIALCALLAGLAASAAAAPFERGILFRLDRPGIASSYVLGTVHSNDPRVIALPAPVRAAFDRTRRVALELVLDDAEQPEFYAAAQYQDGRLLIDAFDAPTLAEIRAALGERAPPELDFARLKPWAVLLLFAQPRTESPALTLDRELLARARASRRPVIGLEMIDEQVAALDAIPLASQVALVRWALAHRATFAPDHERTIAAWLARDLRELDRQARAPGRRDPAIAPHFAALSRHLVENRSALMAHRLFMPLREGRVFVAVGALHLYGGRGLLALLREQGYRVTRVY